jgi:transposase InsO family protein
MLATFRRSSGSSRPISPPPPGMISMAFRSQQHGAIFGWVDIVLVLDWYTKKIVGDYAGTPCTARYWLTALDMAVNRQFPDGARGQSLGLMSDNRSQPTSKAFMQACARLGIHQPQSSVRSRLTHGEHYRKLGPFEAHHYRPFLSCSL